jgi:hypothetical protein
MSSDDGSDENASIASGDDDDESASPAPKVSLASAIIEKRRKAALKVGYRAITDFMSREASGLVFLRFHQWKTWSRETATIEECSNGLYKDWLQKMLPKRTTGTTGTGSSSPLQGSLPPPATAANAKKARKRPRVVGYGTGGSAVVVPDDGLALPPPKGMNTGSKGKRKNRGRAKGERMGGAY